MRNSLLATTKIAAAVHFMIECGQDGPPTSANAMGLDMIGHKPVEKSQ
jgi:hypothetical protein